MRHLLLLIFILLSTLAISQSLTDSLKGYWPFDGNADDYSGNLNHGIVTGATLTTDRFGNPNSAYAFDGDLDVITVAHSSSVDITGDLTIACWVNLEQKSLPYLGRIFIKNPGPNYIIYGLFHGNTNYLYTQLEETGAASVPYFTTADEVITNSEWHHVATTWDNDPIRTYVDGIQVGVVGVSPFTTITSAVSDITIGNGGISPSSTTGILGSIDDVRLYNRALLACEIVELHSNIPCEIGIEELNSKERKIIRILDVMGRETNFNTNQPIIIQFDDGSVERILEIAE